MHSPPGCIINEQKREVNRSSKTPCLKVYIYIYQTLLGMLKGENEAMLYVFRPIHSEYLYKPHFIWNISVNIHEVSFKFEENIEH